MRWLDAVPSTQEVAHLLAESGAVHGTAVAAREQVAGRGTRGRVWHSPLGGLWLSVVCRPRHQASSECFSVRVGLAVAAAIEAVAPGVTGLMLKWPNDLYLEGRKLGGILCEARWQGADLAWIVAGVGINVRNRLPTDLVESAVTLERAAPGVGPEDLAGPVAMHVAERAGAGGPLTPGEMAEFDRRDYLRGRMVAAPFRGVVHGMDRNGALVIREDAGRIQLALAGTVVLA